jgi:hypothetical protein
VTTPLVLVAWKERADVMWGRLPGKTLWRDLHDALIDPRGWAAYNNPDWGYNKIWSPLTHSIKQWFYVYPVDDLLGYFDKITGLNILRYPVR